MILLVLILKIYFIASLLVSGLIKFIDNKSFKFDLHTQKIYPVWSINMIALCVPFIELMLSFGIIGLFLSKLFSLFNVFIFSCFLFVKYKLYIGKSNANCGCFGNESAKENKIIGLVVSIVNILLSIIYALLISHSIDISRSAKFFILFLASFFVLLVVSVRLLKFGKIISTS